MIQKLESLPIEVSTRGYALNVSWLYRSSKISCSFKGKKDLTDNEYLELEQAVGWIDDAISEYQSRREVLAESILIATSKLVNIRASAGFSLLKQCEGGKNIRARKHWN
jgi:hypothetical protein